MPYPTRSCAVINFYTSVVYHVIQREYRDNMISVDIDAGCRVKFLYSKVVNERPESSLYLGKVSHYYDVVSISVIEFTDKQRNDNDSLIFQLNCLRKMAIIWSY